MSTKLTSLIAAYYILLARSFGENLPTERIANQVIAGEPFKIEILARQLPIIESIEKSAYCRPAALRSAAIIQLRMLEAATSANDREHDGEHLNSLGNVIRGSLSCSPADPFLCLIRYWVETHENGFKVDYLKYLRMSYRLQFQLKRKFFTGDDQ